MRRIVEEALRRNGGHSDDEYTQEDLVDWLPKKWREKIKRDRELRELTNTYLKYWTKECGRFAELIGEEVLGSRLKTTEAVGRGYVVHADNTVITLTSAFEQALVGYLEVSDLLLPGKTPTDPQKGRHAFPSKELTTEKVEGYEHIFDQAVGSPNAVGNCSAFYLDRQKAKKAASRLDIDYPFDTEQDLWELFVDSQLSQETDTNIDEVFALLRETTAINRLRLLEIPKEYSLAISIHIAENHKRDLHNATGRQDRDSGSAGVVLVTYDTKEALKQVKSATEQLYKDSKKSPWEREYLHVIEN